MNLLLKITLSILTTLFLNGFIGIGMFMSVAGYGLPLKYKRGKYALISMILMALAICYIPFMLIWHLY